MPSNRQPLDLRPARWLALLRLEMALNSNLRFLHDVWRLIWRYKLYSLAIIAVTVLQELAALWPVSLLGQLVDRLEGGQVGSVVWLLMGASILSPLIVRANVMLRHKMFYENEYVARAEMVIDAAERGDSSDVRERQRLSHPGCQCHQRHHQRYLSYPGQLYTSDHQDQCCCHCPACLQPLARPGLPGQPGRTLNTDGRL